MWRKRTTRQEALAGYLFIAPNLIGFLVFQLIDHCCSGAQLHGLGSN